MKNLIIAILLVTNLFYSINGEFTCKNVDPITDFQKEKILGKWYEITRNPTIFDTILKCIYFNFTSFNDDTTQLGLVAENIYSNEPVLGNAKLIQTVNASTGFFTSDIIIGEISGSLDIGLIAIDYDSYGIFQGCDYQNEIEYIWVMTRERIVTSNQLENLTKYLDERGVKTKYLTNVHQNGCIN